jgi:alpha-ketoglutarate-dependent taurine dioxygenase
MQTPNYFVKIDYEQQDIKKMSDLIRHYYISHIYNVPNDINVEAFYKDLANHVGLLVDKEEDPYTGRLTTGWNKIEFKAETNNSAFKYSNTRQPLHTDYGFISIDLDLTFFYCETQASYGGATFFLDPALLINVLKEYDPVLYNQLTTSFVQFGRAGNKISSRISKIIDFDDQGVLLNWNYYRVSPDNEPDILQMIERFHVFLEDFVTNGGLVDNVLLKKNEAVFFHDKRILHGRNSFLGNRKLMKAAIVTSNIEKMSKIISAL